MNVCSDLTRLPLAMTLAVRKTCNIMQIKSVLDWKEGEVRQEDGFSPVSQKFWEAFS